MAADQHADAGAAAVAERSERAVAQWLARLPYNRPRVPPAAEGT